MEEEGDVKEIYNFRSMFSDEKVPLLLKDVAGLRKKNKLSFFNIYKIFLWSSGGKNNTVVKQITEPNENMI